MKETREELESEGKQKAGWRGSREGMVEGKGEGKGEREEG